MSLEIDTYDFVKEATLLVVKKLVSCVYGRFVKYKIQRSAVILSICEHSSWLFKHIKYLTSETTFANK
jgi:hypothetical protein